MTTYLNRSLKLAAMAWIGTRYLRIMAGSFEHGDESLGSINCG
jgi:hypothetical protein